MASGLAAATASYIPQDELSFTRSYKNSEAVDMAKGLGTLKEAPEFLYVVTDVNANMAVKCKRVWEPQSLALSPVIVELVELRKTNKKAATNKHYPTSIVQVSASNNNGAIGPGSLIAHLPVNP